MLFHPDYTLLFFFLDKLIDKPLLDLMRKIPSLRLSLSRSQLEDPPQDLWTWSTRKSHPLMLSGLLSQ